MNEHAISYAVQAQVEFASALIKERERERKRERVHPKCPCPCSSGVRRICFWILQLGCTKMGCHHIGQDVYNVHVATLAPRRKWRTLASIQRDRNDQQHLPRLHFTRKLPRCHAVQSAATQSQEAALRQQTDQGMAPEYM